MIYKKDDFEDSHSLYHDEMWYETIQLLVEDWKEMYAKIGEMRKANDMLVRKYKSLEWRHGVAYSVAEKTKAQLKEAEHVIKKSWEVCNLSEQHIYDALHRKIDWLEQALIDYEKTKAGEGSAARNLQAEKFKPAATSLKPLTADRADGGETSRRVDVGSEQDSGFTSPATPQACNHQTCPTCRPDSYITRPDGIKRRIV